MREISRLMASPRPVPPYLRLVLPSACWKASKMICCLSGWIPMPVSRTEKESTILARLSVSISWLQPLETGWMSSATVPFSVNLKALDRRFLRTCCRRLASVCIAAGRPLCSSRMKLRPLFSATWRKVRST